MINAMDAVKKASSIKKAAEEHVIPRTTLHENYRKGSGWKELDTLPYLNRKEEDPAKFVEVVAVVADTAV